jgi:hypothetical protein
MLKPTVEKRVRNYLHKGDPLYLINVPCQVKANYLSWACEVLQKEYFSKKQDNIFKISDSDRTFNSQEKAKGKTLRKGYYGNGSELDEETIQRAMIGKDEFIARFGDPLYIEYPVHSRSKGIDIVSKKGEITYCIELKAKQKEGVLKAALEINYYLAKILSEHPHDGIFDHMVKVVLIPKDGDAHMEFKSQMDDVHSFFEGYLGPLDVVLYTQTDNGKKLPDGTTKKSKGRRDFDYTFTDLVNYR